MVDMEAKEHCRLLVQHLAEIGRCVVAFSGGVDSSVVAAAAHQALGGDCLALTGVSPAVSQFDREYAVRIATQIGIRHQFVITNEQADPNYIRNDQRRCYHCKSELYRRLSEVAQREGGYQLVSGTNHDDLGDYRPGLQAGAEFHVRTPLADLSLTKEQVRAMATEWGLDVAQRPAAPCLASRIAYGVSADAEALKMIETAESHLRSLGMREFRVRMHADRLARIELSAADLSSFVESVDWPETVARLRQFGFRYVTLDLAGFQSGSLNRSLDLKTLPIVSM